MNHFDAEKVAIDYALQYPDKDYHDLQHAVIYGVIAYNKYLEETYKVKSTIKIREFIHSINNLCHEKKIPVDVVNLDLLGEAAIELSFLEQS